MKRPVNPGAAVTIHQEKPIHEVPPELTAELDALSSDLHSLSQELAELSRRAELLDERRDAEALEGRTIAMNTP
jgi:hypothetical protein